eukprot:scaffold584308_cov51-Attheya_sp.AAC.1
MKPRTRDNNMRNHYYSRFRLLSRYQWRLFFLFLLGLLLVGDYSHGFVAVPTRRLFGVLPPTDVLTPVTRTSVTRLWSTSMMVPSNATETNLDPSRTVPEEQHRQKVDKNISTTSSVEVQESFPNQVLDNGDVLVSAARVPGCTGILLRTVQDLDCSNPQNQQQQYEIWFSLEGTDESSESQFPTSLPSSLELEERSIIINMEELVGALFHTYLFIEAEQELQQRHQVPPTVPIQLSRQLRVVDPPSKLEPVLKQFGFQQQTTTSMLVNHNNNKDEKEQEPLSLWEWNPLRGIRFLTEDALTHRGTPRGIRSLLVLGLLSDQRLPHEFSKIQPQNVQRNNRNDKKATTQSSTHPVVMERQEQLLSPDIVDKVQEIMRQMTDQSWLSTNLDSVDQHPSLHLNLVSGGQTLFPLHSEQEEQQINDEHEEVRLFQTLTNDILNLLREPIYDTLLSRVRHLTNSSTVQVSDIFLRRYGTDIQSSRNGGQDNNPGELISRFGISAHYDVSACATCVTALDNVGQYGTSGLYTILARNNDDAFSHSVGTSNHKALRRYFPLSSGDGVVHTWNVLHGVDIIPNQTRTSLVVWFTDFGSSQSHPHDNPSIPTPTISTPWLSANPKHHLNNDENDDIQPFVLAIATESTMQLQSEENALFPRGDDNDDIPKPLMMDTSSESISRSYINNSDDDSNNNMIDDDDASYSPVVEGAQEHFHDLYVQSAYMGNAFALTRLGSICQTDFVRIRPDRIQRIHELLQALEHQQAEPNSIGLKRKLQLELAPYTDTSEKEGILLAQRLWWQGAIRGNPLAQATLADSLMDMELNSDHAANADDHDNSNRRDIRLNAAVLFALSAQQEYEGSLDALLRIVNLESSNTSSPIVQMVEALYPSCLNYL